MKTELSIKIGRNIAQARKDKGLTQKEFSAKLFMNQQQYSRFESGIFQLNYEQIVKVCTLLDITPNELFEFDF